MNNQLIRAVNQMHEDMYPMAVALGYVASQVLTSASNVKEMGMLVHIARESVKYTDTFNFIKKAIATWPSWRRPVPQQVGPITQYIQSNDNFGTLLLRVCEKHFLPLFTGLARQHGYDMAKADIQAHAIIVGLFRKMVDQMSTEYRYRLAPGIGRITDHFTIRK